MFWRHRHWLSISLILAIAFSAYSPSIAPAAAKTPCGSSATVSGRLNFASKVEAHRVLICADWLQVKVNESKPRPSRPSQAPAPKPRSESKTSARKPTKPSGKSAIRYSHSTSAAPSTPKIGFSKSNLAVGERAVLRAITRTHSRYRYLLGIPAEVRFTPVSYSWRLADDGRASTRSLSHAFEQRGSKLIRLAVKFAIDFRFAGSKFWRKLTKPIWVDALPQRIIVGQPNVGNKKPRYVFYDCRQQPTALGCLG